VVERGPSAIDRVKERLADYPDLTYTISGNKITIDAPSADGFAVSLIEMETQWIVHFEGWHEHFETEAEALDCLAFGLSGHCRLEITFRGTFPYKWTLQHKTEDGWQDDSTTGLLLFPFWRRRHVEYRQNAVLKPI
jgi:hypothetical protein